MNIKLRDTPLSQQLVMGKLYRNKGSGLLCFAVFSQLTKDSVALRSMSSGCAININEPSSWEDVTHLFTLTEN